MKRLLAILTVICTLVFLVACGSADNASDYNSAGYDTSYDDAAYEVATEEEVGGANYTMAESKVMETSEPVKNQSQRKIIKSASMEVQTLEYDIAVQKLSDKIIGVGGYIESSNVRGKDINNDYATRSAHYTLRIPAGQFEAFMSDMTTVGTVIQSNTSGEDVTSQMFDHEAHIKTLKIQEERLLDILRRAEKIEDVITLERELSNVRYEIEGLTGTLKRLENLVSFSTLSVSLYEVHEIKEVVEKPKTLGEKIAAKFVDSLDTIKDFFEDLTVWALGSLPLLIIYVPLFTLLFVIGRFIYRRFFKANQISDQEEKK